MVGTKWKLFKKLYRSLIGLKFSTEFDPSVKLSVVKIDNQCYFHKARCFARKAGPSLIAVH